ncbi:CBASS cGAMP-activated phospholipase [Bacillus thuringiensis]|uniref:CBASS cGAMP-activated phospholipase n=1 Tax=Bacillus thuringiensis TaxID=1428 RepID=UPI001E427E6B|nr:CBASS cGAMP-activated phospholipase [Bacillus thuringiensis]MCC2543867.1 patatin-like phospholipase family protein [Bacillus thuringiensis]
MIDWESVKNNKWTPRKENEFKILAIDGGGMKGVFPAKYLSDIEEQVGKPIHQYFDLIAGTSTGGIIALGLANDISAKDILELYLKRGKDIFGNRRTILPYSKDSHYGNDGLIQVLQETFGDKLLKEVNTMVCIPSIEHQKASPKVYKTPHHPHFIKDGNIEIWKIALATSAAPIYLPAAVTDDNECKIDGGLWANNPVLVAIAEAVKLGYALDQIKVLSIGTGTSLYEVDNKHAIRGGILSWGANLVDFTMQAQSKGAFYTACYLIGNRLSRIDFETGVNYKLDNTESNILARLQHEANQKFLDSFEKGNIRTQFFSE